MPICSLVPVLSHSQKTHTAHGAFNVNFVCQAEAVIEAHETMHSCAIIQCADPANAFMGGRADFLNGDISDKKKGAERIGKAVNAMAQKTDIPVVLHLDHGKTYESTKVALDAGFSSVMIDGSSLPYDQNVELTREVVLLARKYNASVEGELGVLAGVEDDVFSENSSYTNPMKVVDFVQKTGCDALAISYGTKHGAVKGDNVKLRSEICVASMENLRHSNLQCALVSHGSSLVPKYIVDEINSLGGKISGTGGVPVEELQKVIPCGITKINTDTDIRLAITRNIRRWLKQVDLDSQPLLKEIYSLMLVKPEQFDPRYYLVPVMDSLVCGKTLDYPWFATLTKNIKEGVKEIVYNAISIYGSVGDCNVLNK